MGLTDFGACAWAARELAAQKISTETFKSIMQSKTRLNLVWLISIPIYIVLVDSQFKWACILFAYPFLWNKLNYNQHFLIATNQIMKSVCLRLLERMSWLTIIPLSAVGVEKSLAFSVPILLGLAIHNSMGNIVISSYKDSKASFKKYTLVELFQESRHFGIISISGGMTNLDGFIVASIGSLTESTNYVLAQRFRNPLTLVFSSFATRVKPIAAKRDLKLVKATVKGEAKLLTTGVLANLMISLLAYFYSEMVLGVAFGGINLIMFFGTLTAIPVGILLILTNILSGFGAEKFVARGTLVYVVLLFLMIGVFTHFYGSLGAVISVFMISVAYTFCCAVALINQTKRLEYQQG
jgi:O-antigen/teichoic acid export membrane protein